MAPSTFYVASPDLQTLIAELNAAERQHHITTAHVILAPAVGPCGRAAQKLRDLDSDRWMAEDDLARANKEIARLRVKLGHMPAVEDIVEIATKGQHLAARPASAGDKAEAVWKTYAVDQHWNVGVHDTPGFTVAGSSFIHTPDGFGTTWRFPPR